MTDKELELNDSEIKQYLLSLPTWGLADGKIEKVFKFNDFVEAMKFVNRLAHLAEDQQHHPEISINYNQVKLSLSTHSVNGVSKKDFTLASKADQLV